MKPTEKTLTNMKPPPEETLTTLTSIPLKKKFKHFRLMSLRKAYPIFVSPKYHQTRNITKTPSNTVKYQGPHKTPAKNTRVFVFFFRKNQKEHMFSSQKKMPCPYYRRNPGVNPRPFQPPRSFLCSTLFTSGASAARRVSFDSESVLSENVESWGEVGL